MTAGPPLDPGRARLVLSLLSVTIFVTISYEILPIGLLTSIAGRLQVNEQAAGLLVGGYALVVAVGSIPLSALAAQFNPRTSLLVLLGVMTLSSGLFAASTSLPIAIAARLLGGAGHAIIFTTVYRLALAVVPAHHRGRAANTVALGNGAALALGVPLATALGTASNWRVAFAVLAGGFVVVAVLVLLLVPGQLRDAGQRLSAGAVLTAVRQPPLLRVGLTILVLTAGHFAAYTYIDPILRQAGVAPTGISAVLLGYGVAGVAGLLLVTPLTDRRPRALIIATMTVVVLALAGLLLGRFSVIIAIVAVLAWGLALGAFPVLAQVLAIRASPQLPAAAAPMCNSSFNIGITLGSALGGLVLASVGTTALIATSAAIAAAITGLSLLPGWLPVDSRPLGRGR